MPETNIDFNSSPSPVPIYPDSRWDRFKLFLSQLFTIRQGSFKMYLFSVIGIGLGLLILYGVLRFGVYRLYKAILTKDSPQVSKVVLQPLSVGVPQVIKRSIDTNIALVRVTNSNKGYGQANASFTYEYTSGGERQSGQGSTYILPDETKYILIPLKVGEVQNFKFNLVESKVFVRTAFPGRTELKSAGIQTSQVAEGYFVSGQIYNPNGYKVKQADVLVFLRSPAGTVRGVVATTVESIVPGGTASFEVSWPQPLPVDTIVEVKASVNTFLSDSISIPDQPITPAASPSEDL